MGVEAHRRSAEFFDLRAGEPGARPPNRLEVRRQSTRTRELEIAELLDERDPRRRSGGAPC